MAGNRLARGMLFSLRATTGTGWTTPAAKTSFLFGAGAAPARSKPLATRFRRKATERHGIRIMSDAWDDPRICRGMTEQLRRRRVLLSSGHKPLGWKLAFGGPPAVDRLHHRAPVPAKLDWGTPRHCASHRRPARRFRRNVASRTNHYRRFHHPAHLD